MFLKTIDNDFAQGLIRAFGDSHEKRMPTQELILCRHIQINKNLKIKVIFSSKTAKA